VIWLFVLVLLTIGGGVAAINIASKENKRRQLGSGSSGGGSGGGGKQLALKAGTTDTLAERTVKDLRVNDVLTIDGKDFLCEGLVEYDEDGHRWIGGRVVDGKDVRWLVVGLERTGANGIRQLQQDEATPITGYPPEAIVSGDVRFAVDKRGAATCKLTGDVGVLGGVAPKDRAAQHVERCRWWLYSAPGDDTLLVEQWGSDYRVLKGKKIVDGTIELMPGS
jgi:hypothetical protein